MTEPSQAGPMGLVLPTENDAIFSEDPSRFYMYTYRTFEGVSSRPWTGGRYGLTRNQKRTEDGVIFTKFHEGIDIQPVNRDSAGEPLDDVFAIADGKVAYVNPVASRSSYGNYVVIGHDWGEGPFYSLYAHLQKPYVQVGQSVKAGQRIGRLGHTGAGINRERSHVHVELTMMMSERFQAWYETRYTSENLHGNFNGFNLTGLDLATVFHSYRANPNLTIAEFLSHETPYYKVAVPNRGKPELLERYPWLGKNTGTAIGNPSWEFTFNQYGVPLAIAPGKYEVKSPALSWVRDSKVNHAYNTLARVSGIGDQGQLSSSGVGYVQLASGSF
ncbi:MAG: M23 family metallopeptidase [Verrucomicrobiae bacterium]|nr:M23 family metallopeptidase [Verrucomicrobiae bacterium]